jgi:excisionase family DNA binding protein
MTQPTIERLLSVREAAEILGVARRTVYYLTRDGELPCVRIGDRRLIEPDALRTFIAQRRDPAGQPGLGESAGAGGGDGAA